MHANKLLHLDIKPANIYIATTARPVLIDFGAARKTLSDEAMKLKPMYTPGFASPEHYRKREELGPVERHLLGRRDACTPASPARRRRPATSAWRRTS